MSSLSTLLQTGIIRAAVVLALWITSLAAHAEKVPGTQFYDAAQLGHTIAKQGFDELTQKNHLGNRQPMGIVEAFVYSLRNMAIALGLASKMHARSNALQEVIRLEKALVENYETPLPAMQAADALLKQLLDPELRVQLEGISSEMRLPSTPSSPAAADGGSRSSWAAQMPQVGLGTGIFYVPRDAVAGVVAAAARNHGYRHFDCAQNYGTEEAVGLGLQQSGIPREKLFVSTKISKPEDFGAVATPRLVQQQLQRLGVEYLDLYMFHGMMVDAHREKAAWRALEKLHDSGIVRNLGLSNYDEKGISRIISFAKVPPAYLQIKFDVFHPGYQWCQDKQLDLVRWAQAQNIGVVGYSTFSGWPFLLHAHQDPHVRAIASKYDVRPTQLLLRHSMQKKLAVIPSSVSDDHLEDNMNSLRHAFQISEGDMALLDGLAHFVSFQVNKDYSPKWIPDVWGVRDALREPDERESDALDSDDEESDAQTTAAKPRMEEF